jgi:hypothetical protein
MATRLGDFAQICYEERIAQVLDADDDVGWLFLFALGPKSILETIFLQYHARGIKDFQPPSPSPIPPIRAAGEVITEYTRSGNFLVKASGLPVSQHELKQSKFTRTPHSTKDIHSSGRDNSRRNGRFWGSRAPQLCCWAADAGELDSISFESLSRHVEPGRRSFREIGWSGVCDLGDRRKQ